MTVCHPICCGLDIHKDLIVACLLGDKQDGTEYWELREFRAFRDDLIQLRDWLLEHDCPIVAMESTGIYWRPVYNVLEESVQVILVNARHVKNVPGRKTDMADSKWRWLVSLRHGLLQASFIPPAHVRDWRDLMRMRRGLMEHLGDYKRRIHKVLESANIKLGSVLGDICGNGPPSVAFIDGEHNRDYGGGGRAVSPGDPEAYARGDLSGLAKVIFETSTSICCRSISNSWNLWKVRLPHWTAGCKA